MSAQLLICKFAVFTCVSFFFTDASRDSHGSLACSLSRPVTDLQFTSYQVKNCLTVQLISIKCHLHQRTNNYTYPRIIRPIPSAEQQHSVDKMQCRTREGSSQKLQKVHALWWVSCPSLSLSWLKGGKWKDRQYKLGQVIFKKGWCYEMLILTLDHVVNSDHTLSYNKTVGN